MTQVFGYPAVADIEDVLADEGIEKVSLGNTNYEQEFLQMLWAILNRGLWAGALGVWLPTSATFNVRGGKYLFKDEVKTYTPGAAVNPTDNDTTYIWLKPDNTIGSGIDGSGWPATEHIKLAEIDVDAAGAITAVRDLRGETFMTYSPGIVKLTTVTGVNLNAAADTETELFVVPTGKKAVIDKVVIRGLSADAAAAVVTFGKTGGACNEFLGDQTLSNLNGTTKAGILQPVPSATPVAQTILNAAESFGCEITTPAGSACTCVMDVFGHLYDA